MPLPYVLDEHLRGGPIWNAVRGHNARGVNPLDVVRVGDFPGLPLGSTDPDILLWCEREGRILISEDRRTLPRHLADHLNAGHHCPGIFTVPQLARPLPIVAFLEAAAYASEAHEWADRIEYL